MNRAVYRDLHLAVPDGVKIGVPVDYHGGAAAMLQCASRSRRQLGAEMPANLARTDEVEKLRSGNRSPATGQAHWSPEETFGIWDRQPRLVHQGNKTRQESGVGAAGWTITGQPTAIARSGPFL